MPQRRRAVADQFPAWEPPPTRWRPAPGSPRGGGAGERRTPSGAPGGVSRFTANSISTGELVPEAPTSRSSFRISARGNMSSFRIGAMLTRRTRVGKGRRKPRCSGGVGGPDPMQHAVLLRHAQGGPAPVRPLPSSFGVPSAVSQPQGPELPLRVADHVLDRGELHVVARIRGAEPETGRPFHYRLAEPKATAAIPSAEVMGAVG